MTPGQALQRSRAFAEQATHLRLNTWVDHLLLFGQVAEGEWHNGWCVAVTAPVEKCDLGLVVVRWSRLSDPLALSLSGWVLTRVGFGQRLKEPKPGDVALARERLRALGLDPNRPLWQQEAS